ncbi:MAG: molecular chaperone TorD family protein [Telluria sp.]|nr:molecular chaperone TorD family protein [Telluria sp.]
MQLQGAEEIGERGPLVSAALPLPGEDQARADLYALVARLLFAPPDADLLANIAGATCRTTGNALDRAWKNLVRAARSSDLDTVHDEFNELFISSGTPRINPYGSLYLSGFLNEKPLAQLRTDLARHRLARRPGVGEMEDHLAALCDTMRLLIAGEQNGQRQTLRHQQQFFETHIGPWYARCLGDIRREEAAQFYRLVADFAAAFLAVEALAFEIGDE